MVPVFSRRSSPKKAVGHAEIPWKGLLTNSRTEHVGQTSVLDTYVLAAEPKLPPWGTLRALLEDPDLGTGNFSPMLLALDCRVSPSPEAAPPTFRQP